MKKIKSLGISTEDLNQIKKYNIKGTTIAIAGLSFAAIVVFVGIYVATLFAVVEEDITEYLNPAYIKTDIVNDLPIQEDIDIVIEEDIEILTDNYIKTGNLDEENRPFNSVISEAIHYFNDGNTAILLYGEIGDYGKKEISHGIKVDLKTNNYVEYYGNVTFHDCADMYMIIFPDGFNMRSKEEGAIFNDSIEIISNENDKYIGYGFSDGSSVHIYDEAGAYIEYDSYGEEIGRGANKIPTSPVRQ